MSFIPKSQQIGNQTGWTRIHYDPLVSQTNLKENVSIGDRTLDPCSVVRCDQCLPQVINGKEGTSYYGGMPLVDTDSSIRGLTNILSKDQKMANPLPMNTSGMVNFPDCDIKPRYTMFDGACKDVKEVNINRFEPTCVNYQAENRWLYQRIGLDARQDALDKCCPPQQMRMDQSAFQLHGAPDVPCTMTPPRCLNWSK